MEIFLFDEFVLHDIAAIVSVVPVSVCRPDGWLSVVALRPPPLLSLGPR